MMEAAAGPGPVGVAAAAAVGAVAGWDLGIHQVPGTVELKDLVRRSAILLPTPEKWIAMVANLAAREEAVINVEDVLTGMSTAEMKEEFARAGLHPGRSIGRLARIINPAAPNEVFLVSRAKGKQGGSGNNKPVFDLDEENPLNFATWEYPDAMFDGVPGKLEKDYMEEKDVERLLDNSWLVTQQIPQLRSYIRPVSARNVWDTQVAERCPPYELKHGKVCLACAALCPMPLHSNVCAHPPMTCPLCFRVRSPANLSRTAPRRLLPEPPQQEEGAPAPGSAHRGHDDRQCPCAAWRGGGATARSR